MEMQREVRLLVDGGSFFECPRMARGPLVGVGLSPPLGVRRWS